MTLDKAEQHRRERIVSERDQGISPMFEAFYLEAIIYAANCADTAFQGFSSALASRSENAKIVASVHEALTHSAALSRFFWASPKARGVAHARAGKLRSAFGLTEASALYDRDLRNALEHFDERLDAYLLEDHAGFFFPSPIVAEASFAEDELAHIFRLVDPIDQVFVLLGQQYEFGRTRQEVQAVLASAYRMVESGSRLLVTQAAVAARGL